MAAPLKPPAVVGVCRDNPKKENHRIDGQDCQNW